MKILAVDTSLSSASIAVLENKKLLGEILLNQNKTHSEKFMPALKILLDTLGIQVSEIELFAAGIGPGSFTGLRIGVTTIKSMAFSLNKPVIGINTLDAIAYNAGFFGQLVAPVIDARNNQIFTALYRNSISEEESILMEEYKALPILEYLQVIKDKYNEKIVFLGDYKELHKDMIIDAIGENAIFASRLNDYPKASAIGVLANIKFEKGEYQKPEDLEPFYLRSSQAERMQKLKEDN